MSWEKPTLRLVPRTSLGRLVASFVVIGLTAWVPFGYLGLHSVGFDRPILAVFLLAGVVVWWILLRSALDGFHRAITGRQKGPFEDGFLEPVNNGKKDTEEQ